MKGGDYFVYAAELLKLNRPVSLTSQLLPR
jgi:hypothetical protein